MDKSMVSFDQIVSTAIRRHGERYAAPASLALRIGEALESTMRSQTRPFPMRAAPARRPLALAASFLLAIMLSSGATWYATTADHDSGFAEELIANHARSMLADHLTDVASSDQHTVKPWLGSRLDQSPPVFDLASRGFPLLGARLDYLDQRRVAALVYKRGFHFINVFVWPIDESSMPVMTPSSLRGFNIRRWTGAGFVFYAVSDADPTQMEKLEQRMRQALDGRISRLDRNGAPALYVDFSKRSLSPLAFQLHLAASLPAGE